MRQRTDIALLVTPLLLVTLSSCSDDNPTKSGPPTLNLTKSAQEFEPMNTYQVALGDLDDDGDIDAVFSNMSTTNSSVWLNDGTGMFTDSAQNLTAWGHGVGLGDLDGDGDLDAFITCASESHRSRVYLNNGAGVFYDSGQRINDLGISGNGVRIADVDGDMDLDVFVVYYQQPDRLYLNDGSAVFSVSAVVPPEGAFCGHLNGDGYIDLFVKDFNSGYRTMTNDGLGNFTRHWQVADTTCVYGGVAIADMDGDGDRDAIIGNGDHTGNHPTKVMLNNGHAGFSDSGQVLNETNWARFGVGDLNGDGTPDVFVSNFDRPNEVWLNDGSGILTDSGLRMTGDLSDNTTYVAMGDLDNDGDLDVFVANFIEGGNEIWFSGN
jgi:hypothetical protein